MAQPSQADIFAALTAQAQAPLRRDSPSTSPYSAFSDPVEDLTTSRPGATIEAVDEKENQGRVNNRRIYCPREGCGSWIMSEGVGEWMTVDGPVLPIDPSSPFPPAPTISSRTPFWHITSSPFAFDNIGFSKPDTSTKLPPHAPGQETSGLKGKTQVKWLICAECDLGPLGWSYEGGKEAWLAVERVKYGEVKKVQ
ncbi:hypothetical protein CI109_107177 [Kwoniella shandongensis]|uniref:Uncharacterized protein n=1 Tax=Kwoniella shandongensis TaxID=1734106 RepID=A0A5M6C7D5_9TREE|nr:uncharacterized protein CI109_002460 [Kwoniella shandongensis]KAA5529119.1 hypothetical protein CI109_002460 [Kwoniella shandongensis]